MHYQTDDLLDLITFEWFMTLFFKLPSTKINNQNSFDNCFSGTNEYVAKLTSLMCLDGDKCLVKTAMILLEYGN